MGLPSLNIQKGIATLDNVNPSKVDVSAVRLNTNSVVMVSYNTLSGGGGVLSVPVGNRTFSATVGVFRIKSSVQESSTVDWAIIG